MACEPECGDDGAPPQDVSEEGWGAALGDGAGAIYAPQVRQKTSLRGSGIPQCWQGRGEAVPKGGYNEDMQQPPLT